MDPRIANTPEPPYYAVMFTSRRSRTDAVGYDRMARAMAELASEQPGFLGMESTRDAEGVGITLAFFRTEADVRAWKQVAAHREAQSRGRDRWYEDYAVRVARVERAYGMATSPREGLG